ncbi:MAG TPA: hypothetical protein VM735_05285 [Candidatus Kapabacteria bacterium]|nr:hypothetical protein [Candidatus Kapabacteria bacterium]
MQNGTESVLLYSIHLDAPDLLGSLSHSQPPFFENVRPISEKLTGGVDLNKLLRDSL